MRTFARWFMGSLIGLALAASASAAAQEFNFKDPKGVNSMSFVLDSEIEPIMGLATGISGEVSFDPADAKKTAGKIVVDAATVNCSNPMMTKALHGADWLNVEKNKEITFTFKEVKEARTAGENEFELSIRGDFSCAGVTKELTIPVRISYKKDAAGHRLQGTKGDLLILRTSFSISRKDFKIQEKMGEAHVSDEIQIRAAIVGATSEK